MGILFLLTPGALSIAQDREYIIDHFNISNGLISDMVYKIVVDQEGHTWMISYNGLQKYNGYEFVTYTSNPDKPGNLSGNFIENIFEDKEGDLIVVLEDGIDVYDKQTDRFNNLLSNVPFRASRRNEISRRASAVQDRSGSIWVNCNNQVVRIDSLKRNFIEYTDDFSGHFVLNMDSTSLWIIADQVLKKYDLEKNLLSFFPVQDIPSSKPIQRLNTILYDSKGLCWIGTSTGLFVLDEANLSFLDYESVFTDIPKNREDILHSDITAIYEDFRSDLWIASGSRLQRIERKTGTTQLIQHEFDNPNSILDEQITGIHGDRMGTLWITYLNEGISRINIRTRDFRSYRYRPGQARSLGGKTVRSVFLDQRGFLWLGLYNNGLDRVHPVSGKISHFKEQPGINNSICSNYISSILMDRHQRLWVGSHDNGLCFTDQAYNEHPGFQIPHFLNLHEEIYHILEDSYGRIWFGCRNGLGVFDYESNSFHWVLKEFNVQSFIIDDPTIWIASWNSGLCKLSFTDQQFSSDPPEYDTISSVFSGSPQNCISIYREKNGIIWLGTYDRGLVMAKELGGKLAYEIFDLRDGAPGNSVYGVLGDDQGKIWISTQNGLGKFDPQTRSFENYYREDGLLSNYFMWKAYFKAPDGKLLFGSVDGLNFFDPALIENDTMSPKVLISELRIHNQPVKYGDTIQGDVILKSHIAYQDTLVLNHRNNDFSFRFYASGHVNPQKLRYAHMLVGYNKDWILSDSQNRSASYGNLDAGTYFFRVRTTDHLSSWPETFNEKVVIILPPWWKTKVAYLIYLILIVGLIFLITNALIRFLGLKQELIYNEKLHQSKLMFFTNISHEFKTPLSLIKAPLDDILNQSDLIPQNRKNFLVARENADNLLYMVDELLEFRRTDTGNSTLKAEKTNLIRFVEDLARQFEYLAEQKGVHFYFHIPDGPFDLWVDQKKFRRIINNLLGNALKYTKKEGLVTLSFIKSPSTFRFKPNLHTLQVNHASKNLDYVGVLVSDTGMGISRESLPRIFDRFYQIEPERASQHIGSGIGLALVKNLVLLHHGEIRVASERGVGTEILVLLPMGKAHLKKEELVSDVIDSSFIPVDKSAVSSPNYNNAESQEFSAKPSILLVEDHEDLRVYLKGHLSDDYRVFEASNGREGLQLISRVIPDVVITDWIMPEMDGASFIREIRSNDRTVALPIILLTAKSELKDRNEGLEMGADLVILKPFNIRLLIQQVKSMIENNKIRLRKFSMENMENLVHVKESRDAGFLEELESIIRAHIMDTDLNAASIAREMGISRTSLYERIKSISGYTIGGYIQKIRLKYALRLMLYENVSVSEVYVKVGFSSSSYFIRLFKKQYKTTPKEYVRNYLKTSSN
ncbi:MAG: two-component regulator propeller domain-containing protein [Bacteroidales bacterium]